MLRTGEHSKRPRILFVGAFPPPYREIFGGNVTCCKILMESSLPARTELTLLDTTQISNPPPAFPLRLLLAMRRLSKYLVLFERRRPDAVFLFCALGASIVEKGLMAWYARFRGANALMFPRAGAVIDASYGSRLTRSWVRVAFGGARKILCQGPAWQRFAVSLGFRREDAPIIPNWTATRALLSIGRRRSFNLGDRPVRLLFLGWLEREKGVFELIEACRQLSESRRFAVDIVGEGKASASSKELVVRYGLGETVRFRGWLRGADLESALAEADVLVLPSWAEGLPNAMVEAMAVRLAVVATAVGEIPDTVTDGREALLVPPRNVSALKAALERVIDDPVLRRNLGDAAFALAASRWDVEQAVEGMLQAMDFSGSSSSIAETSRGPGVRP